ncbi:MAG: HAD family phosphatase [Chlamydiales bacterium]|nr:HAD family phosphatase [Chlamydiales bacterium]
MNLIKSFSQIFMSLCISALTAQSPSVHENYKNIVFDLGGVLLEWAPQKFLSQVFENSDSVPDELVHIFNSSYWTDYDAGKISREDLLNHLSLHYDRDQLILFINQLPQLLRPVAEMERILDDLKSKGYKIYSLSNTPQEIFYELNEIYDLFKKFDGKVASFQIKSSKPSPLIYQTLLSLYHLKPEECLFIDDRAENVLGAQDCGIKGILYLNPKQLKNTLKELGIL